jgi:aspartyl-tRNA(Asn)/glutamyl-tRNA(Gln) amidotransferase subunit C
MNKEQIEYLSKLAKLDITEQEKEKYAEQLSSILDYFEQIKETDVKNVEYMAHVLPLANVLRKDQSEEIFATDKALAEAPDLLKKQVRVPSVFEK